MPGRDGTGPLQNSGKRGGGARSGAGPGGYCICPSCGTKIPHKIGSPCFDISCPKCGTKMVRE